MRKLGRYELVGELGRGAMGIVYRANDPVIGRTVAIKTIRLGDITDPVEHQRLRERLFREARSAGILSHPNIVTVYDIGEQGEVAYIAMEFVNGTTLEGPMRAKGGIEKHVVLSVLYETATALDYAHSKGIIHRDIKPANIMINENGAAKIADFGVAKILSQQVTQADLVLGTPSYMSPEQIEAKTLDGRSDQFALAVIAYELLTGDKPFLGDTLPSLLFKIVREDPVSPHLLNPTLGEPCGAAIVKALAKPIADRFPTCLEFVQALTAALHAAPAWRPLARGDASNMATVVSPIPEVDEEDTTAGRTRAAAMAKAKQEAASGESAAVAVPPEAPPPQQAAPQSMASSEIASAAPPPLEPVPPPEPAEPAVGVAAGDYSHSGSMPRARREEIEAPPPSNMVRNVALAGGVVVLAAVAWFAGSSLLSSGADAPPKQEQAQQQGSPSDPLPPLPSEPPPPPSQLPEPPAEQTPSQTPQAPPPARGPRLFATEIASEPAGAMVTFDTADATCTTPCAIQLQAGRHVLRAERPSYRAAVRIINLPQDANLKIVLDREMGQLAIRSNPTDAQILINGQPHAKRTPAIIDLPVGKYKVQLRKQGVRDWEEDVDVVDRVIRTIDVSW